MLELWGIKIGPIIAGLGLFGVAVALGAQDLFKNLISGILVLVERRFQVGDWIFVEDVIEGTVESIGFRSTVVRRFDKSLATIPNFQFAEKAVINNSQITNRRISWVIGLEYRTTSKQLTDIKKINEDNKMKYNLAASFQKTINKILYKKTKIAIKIFREKTQAKEVKLIVAGGVAANQSIRENLSNLGKEMKFETIFPSIEFCGDNAAMIACAAIQRFKRNLFSDINLSAKSRWPLDENAPYMKGPGLKL